MHCNARMFATLTAAGALLALPATGLAAKGGQGGPPKAKAKSCATAKKLSYRVSGTLESVTLDVAGTPADEGSVTLKVTSANEHARRSGEIADQNAARKGVQVRGATITVAATDAFTLKLNGYEGTDTPSVGDRVRVSGRIAVTKKHCAAAGTSTADRYAEPDVKTVTISDRDADA
jgi:citrate lyase gamma subunit